MIVLLAALLVVPVAAWLCARRFAPEYLATITGASLGLVISPVSMGLYATYFLGPLGIVTGMIGLVSGMFHVAPGFYIARTFDLVPPGVVEGIGHFYVEAINGLVWAVAYGALGRVIDHARRPRVAL
jgi:ABC-type molybdate transport system permease subunit